MKRRYSVTSHLRFGNGVQVTLDHYPLEVSLDCHVCGRGHRTIVMSTTGEPATYPLTPEHSYTVNNHGLLAKCTPTGHEYPGQMESVAVLSKPHVAIQIVFNCDFEPFVDLKHGTEAKDECTWARISFSAQCPQCGKAGRQSTQTNLGRPHRTSCSCGNLLYDDIGAPLIEKIG